MYSISVDHLPLGKVVISKVLHGSSTKGFLVVPTSSLLFRLSTACRWVSLCVSLSERYVYRHREYRAHEARVESCLLQLTKR
jgi:hypothetical protein